MSLLNKNELTYFVTWNTNDILYVSITELASNCDRFRLDHVCHRRNVFVLHCISVWMYSVFCDTSCQSK